MKRAAIHDFVRRWWAFTLLCIASFVRFALLDSGPQLTPTPVSLAAASSALCVTCVIFLLARRRAVPHKSSVAKPMIAGVLLICGPEIALLLRADDLAGSDLFLAGSLVPVVVAIAAAARSRSGGLSGPTLWAGIAASAALLLLFPEPRIHFLDQAAVLILLPVLTGTGAVLLSEAASEANEWWGSCSLAGVSLVFLLFVALHQPSDPFSWFAFTLDLVVTSCTLLSVSHIGEVRYSSYFVLLPLLLSLYGLALLRPALSMRSVLGLLMLLMSAVVLLRAKGGETRQTSFRLLE